ncbi:MAG: trigger factor [Kordiimonas sp.]|nr:trigger factor [Kordiimonas sp.]
MQVVETLSEGLKRGYKVVVAAQDIDERLDTELDKLKDQIKMPGFRPGKAPASLLKKLHGPRLMGQILEETIQQTSQNALDEQKVRPAMQPKVEIASYEDGADLEYTIEVEIIPDFELPDFSDITLEKNVVEIEDKEVEEFLSKMTEQQKNFAKAAKTYKAKEGDAVLIDFLGKINDVAFDGGEGTDFELELGSNTFIPGFEDQLVGQKTGAEVAVTVTFPEEYGNKDLAGKEAVFDVTVKEVRKPAPVEINDELATRMGMENLEALKEAVKEQIGKENDNLSRTQLKRALLDVLAEKVTFDVPEGMVEMEFEQIWQQLKFDMYREASEDNPELKPDDVGEPDESLRDEYMAIAVRRVRLGLLLAEIGQSKEITVAQEEVSRMVAEEARRYPGQEQQVFEYYQKNPQALAQLRAPLFEDKVVDYILELATVTEKSTNREQLIAAMEADEEAAAPKKKAAAKKKAAPKKKAAAKKPAAKDADAKKAAPKKTAAKKTTKKTDKAE